MRIWIKTLEDENNRLETENAALKAEVATLREALESVVRELHPYASDTMEPHAARAIAMELDDVRAALRGEGEK